MAAKLAKISRMGEAKHNAYRDIRNKIIRLQLTPGTDLDENQLVERYGLSRTPIREILIRLAAEGLVDIKRNRGANVASLDLDDLQSVFEAGDYLERGIIRLACQKRSDEDLAEIERHMLDYERAVEEADTDAMVEANTLFHERIAAVTGNKYFLEVYRRILVDHERIGQLWYARNLKRGDVGANQAIMKQHRKFFTALKKGDGDLGEIAVMEHSNYCKDGIRAFLSSGDGYVSEVSIEPVDL